MSLVAASTVADAQNNREYYAGLGIGSFQEATIRAGLHPLLDIPFISNETHTRSYSTAGPIRIGLKHHEGKHLMLGGEFNYTNVETLDKYSSGATVFTNFQHYTLMGSANYKYIDKPGLTLYTGGGLGVCFAKATNHENNRKMNDLYLAFQADFLGVRVGKTVGFFAEVGYGFNGFLSGGLFYRMN